MGRRTCCWMMLICLVLCLVAVPGQALADTVNYVQLTLDERPLDMDVRPFIDANNRTIVPISFISQSMGYDVGWDGADKKVTIAGRDRLIELWIGSRTANAEADAVILDTEPVIMDGRTMVPLRFVMETLGASVGYEADTRTVTLMSPSDERKKVVREIRVDVSSVLNVRREPRTDRDNIIGKAADGSVWTVRETDSGWYRIDYDGVDGWVSADYCHVERSEWISVADDDATEEQRTPEPGEIPTRTVTKVEVDVSYGSSLHVRSEASLSAPILGKVVRGDRFPHLGTRGDWYQIEYADTTGYVHSDYADLIEVEEIDFDQVDAKRCRVNSPVVNVRSTPEVKEDNSNRITQVLFGSDYDILDSTEEWYQIRLDEGTSGWLVKRAVDLIDEHGNLITVEGIEMNKRNKLFILNTDNVNIRKGPDTDQEILGQADAGEAFSILGTERDWYRLALSDGRTGYVASWLGHVRSEILHENQIVERDRAELAALASIRIDGDDVIVESDQDLLYEVFVLANPARALIQFHDVQVPETLLGARRASGSRLSGVEVLAYGESTVRMILSFEEAATLVVSGDDRLGQKRVTFHAAEAPLAGRTVVIDPGHGAYKDNGRFDVGATSPMGIYEYVVNNDIAQDITNRLMTLGARVILTHEANELITMDLDDRVALANSSGADIFVSIHSDSYPDNPAACGMATYYYHGNGNIEAKIDLASEVLDGLALHTGRPNNGIKNRRFHVIRYTDLPSILVEVGFLSNRVEEQLLKTASFRSRAAEGIVQGIRSYFEGQR